MMGRAGRPQYDEHGVAVILVHDIKKHFYKKFLYEPFPVESRWLFLDFGVNVKFLLWRDTTGMLPGTAFHRVAIRWLHYGHADFVPLLWADLVHACIYIAQLSASYCATYCTTHCTTQRVDFRKFPMKSSTPSTRNAYVSVVFVLDWSSLTVVKKSHPLTSDGIIFSVFTSKEGLWSWPLNLYVQ